MKRDTKMDSMTRGREVARMRSALLPPGPLPPKLLADIAAAPDLTAHTPGPWWVGPGFSIESVKVENRQRIGRTVATVLVPERMPDEARANARLIAAAPELLAALSECLAQLTGPAGVWGDGRGNDGKKTGLSGDEFNALRDSRIEKARAAIALAEGGEA